MWVQMYSYFFQSTVTGNHLKIWYFFTRDNRW